MKRPPKEKNHRNGRARIFLTVAIPVFLLAKAILGIFRALKGYSKEKDEGFPFQRRVSFYQKHKRIVQTGSGIPIKVSLFIPMGEGPFPAVIMVHSWGLWRIQCDFLYAPLFARNGYVVMTYDCRGWGTSGGEVSCAAPDREICDLEDLITWLTEPDSGVPVDPERIGIAGVSYGGGHSFMIATRDSRIKAAAPMNGWTDLNFSLMPNNCWKAVWSLLLFFTALFGIKLNPKNDLVRWLKEVVSNRDLNGVRNELEERSVVGLHERVNCPVFVVHSWNDDLFEPNQILDFYSKLEVPKRLFMTNGIHGFDAGRGTLIVPNDIWSEVLDWFDYWLKGDESAGENKPEVMYYCPWTGAMQSADSWPPDGVSDFTYYLRGFQDGALVKGKLLHDPPDGAKESAELIINNTVFSLHTSGIPVIRTRVFKGGPLPTVPFSLKGDSASYTSHAFLEDTVLLGIPRVSVYVSSSSHECQLNAFLYDLSPSGLGRLVTHGCVMKSDMVSHEATRLDFSLIGCAHRFRAGNRMRLLITACDPLFVMPSRVPSRYLIHHTKEYPSQVVLPLMPQP